MARLGSAKARLGAAWARRAVVMAARRASKSTSGTGTHGSNSYWTRLIAEAEAAAERTLRTAKPCDKCGGLVTLGGRSRHYGCEPGSLAGLRCSCPPDCTRTKWGDGPRDCDPECRPCRMMRGKPLVEPAKKAPRR